VYEIVVCVEMMNKQTTPHFQVWQVNDDGELDA
jgi:hypothetical protein